MRTGERKNQSIRRLERSWERSRYRGVRAETIRTRPIVRTSWTIMTGKRAREAHPTLTRNTKKRRKRSGRLRRKFTVLARTVTVGRIWRGKKTFLIRPPPSTMEVAPIRRDEANQVHGSNPVRRKGV